MVEVVSIPVGDIVIPLIAIPLAIRHIYRRKKQAMHRSAPGSRDQRTSG